MYYFYYIKKQKNYQMEEETYVITLEKYILAKQVQYNISIS